MGKRQIRVLAPQILSKIKEFEKIEINLILFNQVTLHGEITQINENYIQFKDTIKRKHIIQIADIQEINSDKTTLY